MAFSGIKKRIVTILADGRFHSGTELSRQLHICRSAIWKQLHLLHELGIEIIAVNGKGYRLTRPIELFDKQKISAQLSRQAKSAIAELLVYDQIASTNRYLVEQSQNGAPSGLICLAEYQSAGKGRRGRQWVSPFGHNIYLSLLWRYQCGPSVISAVSLVVGIALIRVLRNLGIDEIGLKWPNDIYWRNKKLGGILVEVSGESEGPCAVVIGLGLNVFLSVEQAAGITQDWVDLSEILADAALPSRNELAARIIDELIGIVHRFEQEGIGGYVEEWRRYDCMLGKSVVLQTGNQQISGIVSGIDDSGLLKLQHIDGSIRVYSSGEVSFNAT